jgi:hypothetical protein
LSEACSLSQRSQIDRKKLFWIAKFHFLPRSPLAVWLWGWQQWVYRL